MENKLPKIVAVIGPTGSGKTELGAFLCRELGGEIVSADSMQIYRGMDVGTAKETDLPVRQRLIDICEPGEKMTVGRYQVLAYAAIDGLLAAGKLPVLVGVSGLYAESVLEGYLFGGRGYKEKQPRYASLKLGIDMDRDALRERVAARTAAWVTGGLLEEIRGLLEAGVAAEWLEGCGQEYRYFTRYLRREIGLEEAIEKTNTSIGQYVKRTYTWWRRHPDVRWVGGADEALRETRLFLES